jgi:hypothetical protein
VASFATGTQARFAAVRPARAAAHSTISSVILWCVTVWVILPSRRGLPQPSGARACDVACRGKSQRPAHHSFGPRRSTSTRPPRQTTTAVSRSCFVSRLAAFMGIVAVRLV